VDLLPTSPQKLRRRLLRPIVAGIKIEPSRSPCKVLNVWDTIDLAIHVRIVISGIILSLIIVVNGMAAEPIGSYEPEARRTRTLKSWGSIDPMGLSYRE
jgi:hypothetical protein